MMCWQSHMASCLLSGNRQADPAEYQGDSDEENHPPADVKWGAVKFVVAAMASDRRFTPGDVADLEGRAAGR
jgi:hypothetical protein